MKRFLQFDIDFDNLIYNEEVGNKFQLLVNKYENTQAIAFGFNNITNIVYAEGKFRAKTQKECKDLYNNFKKEVKELFDIKHITENLIAKGDIL